MCEKHVVQCFVLRALSSHSVFQALIFFYGGIEKGNY